MPKKSINYEKGLTFEKVWAGIQELGKKYDAIFEREAKERQEREERETKESEKRRKEAEERMKKLEEEVNKTTLSVNRLSENMGGLSNRFGEMVEHLVAPNIAERFNELGYHFNKICNRVEFRENGQVITEVDLLLENEKTVAIIEIKSNPTTHDIKKHLKRMQIVRRDFERSGTIRKELIGAVAGAIFSDEVKDLTLETGFYVIAQTGDTVKIDVPEHFKPRIF
ncbi:MAG: hypothetical protein LBF88_10560 [Planctomycetaceae bacterium]|jgi:hypothetical protein|nr:hypothetical protein [Planctomycetaceae bacterium]